MQLKAANMETTLDQKQTWFIRSFPTVLSREWGGETEEKERKRR